MLRIGVMVNGGAMTGIRNSPDFDRDMKANIAGGRGQNEIGASTPCNASN
jgi:hypothetical protein